MFKKVLKNITVLALAVTFAFGGQNIVKADEIADETAKALQAQQALLYEQQLKAIQEYQQAILLQYQQALADQYAKALLVQQAFAKQQQDAVQQAYLLNAIQAQQKAQYQSMINATGAEYSDHLMSEYLKYQDKAKTSFLGYEGLK